MNNGFLEYIQLINKEIGIAERTERVVTTETEPTVGGNRATTQTEVVTEKGRGGTLAGRVIKFIAGVVITLLVVRFLLFLLEASRTSGFVDFILSVTAPLIAPFNGIFGNPSDTVRIEPQTITAIVVYALIAWGLVYLVRIRRPRATAAQ